jgi:thioredoxin-like negative regulator of GroEL
MLARKQFDTRFIKINVENAPFLVTKLKVQVLPCVIAFINGIGQDRIIGFEGLGRGDKFTTIDLETRLLGAGVLTRAKLNEDDVLSRKDLTSKPQEEFDDEDWD